MSTACLPDGFKKQKSAPAQLSVAEIAPLVRSLAELGIWKIRLTGGEPLVRRDILQLAETVINTAGIRKVALTSPETA